MTTNRILDSSLYLITTVKNSLEHLYPLDWYFGGLIFHRDMILTLFLLDSAKVLTVYLLI
jgi:hypothetical protein